MKIRNWIAIFAAKLTIVLAKILRRGGTSLPGEVALKLSPRLPEYLLRDQEVVLISGTNGKTSTMHFLATICQGLGYDVVANWAGANLVYGITTTVLKSKPAKPGKERIYIFEIDEAHLSKYGQLLQPKQIILTNLFADQTDRYGSVAELRERLRQGIYPLPEAVNLYLAADDPQLTIIGNNRDHNCYYFGHEVDPVKPETNPAAGISLCSDQDHSTCPACGGQLNYSWRTFGQHGGFSCSNCLLTRHLPDLGYRLQADGAELYDHLHQTQGLLQMPVPGTHNLINAAAAILPLLVKGHSLAEIIPCLKTAQTPFGRMEKFSAQGRETTMILVKNPVGLQTGLSEAAKLPRLASLVLMINKRINDGLDDTWLADLDYAKLLPASVLEGKAKLIICGESADYLSQLLDQAGISHQAYPDYQAAWQAALDQTKSGEQICLLPNYSAMWDFRADLAKTYDLQEAWSDR